jgi:hypothetical protein
VCTIGWDLKRDKFELGQWLRGRIYERRADLSPDGRYLIYFAMNGRWQSVAKGAWTAISKTPWLKAELLFPWGTTYGGGGLFTSNKKYWLNGGRSPSPTGSTKLERDNDYGAPFRYPGCASVYYLRLQRDGWALIAYTEKRFGDSMDIFEKAAGNGWVLRKFAHEQLGAPQGHGPYWDEHELEHPASGDRIEKPKWEWADVENGNLVWAEAGCLYRASIGKRGLGKEHLLLDANPMKFERRIAPY